MFIDVLFLLPIFFQLSITLVIFINFLTKPLLEIHQSSTTNEKISILIPARNEEDNLPHTLDSLIKIEDFIAEIFILDDHSTDKTAEIIEKYAQKYPVIKLIKGTALPESWLGKNWACHQLAEKAHGNYILFIDADVQLEKDAIEAALFEMKKDKLALLSIFPTQIVKTWGEKIVVPIMKFILLSLLPLFLVKKKNHHTLAAANGQFMLFDKKIYDQIQPHAQVRNRITEDISIMKMMKKDNLAVNVLLGNNLVRCRMYHSGKEALAGFSKNFFEGFGNHFIGLLIFLYCVGIGQLFLWKINPLLALTSFILMIIQQMLLAKMSNLAYWELVFLHPMRIIALHWIAFSSVKRTFTKNNVWKDRKVG
jgi:chlorobactene glucosyltransferase